MVHFSIAPFLNLFLNPVCPLCDRSGQPILCQDCNQQLQDCRQPPSSTRPSPANDDPFPIISWGRYEGSLKRAIAQLKYHNSPALATPLGARLAEAWLQSQAIHSSQMNSSQINSSQPNQSRWYSPQNKKPWVIPVPMHPQKQRQRGFNQAELIARSFCRHTGLPLLTQGLQRITATRAQFELSPAERQRNVAQAFSLGPALCQKKQHQKQRLRPVLLLDDIYTTGATVGAIAQVLTAAQIPLTGVVVVARASK